MPSSSTYIRDGRVISSRDGYYGQRGLKIRGFSVRKFLFLATLFGILFLTNPAHDEHHQFMNFIHNVKESRFGFGFKLPGMASRKEPKYKKNPPPKDVTYSIGSKWLGIEINFSPPPILRDWMSTYQYLWNCGDDYNTSSSSSSFSWGKRTQYTNHFIFSLSKNYNGVNVHMLGQNIHICDYSPHTAEHCATFSKTFCHGMHMWDANNRPFTALRLIQMTKFISYILQQCLDTTPSTTLWPYVNSSTFSFFSIFTSMASTLHQIPWYSDLIFLHVLVYPILQLMDRITISGTDSDDQASTHFYATVFILLYLIGGMANQLAFFVTGETRIRGMNGSIAATLGYCMAAKPHQVLVEHYFFGIGNGSDVVELTSSDILFQIFVMSTIACFLGLSFGPLSRMSDCVAWAFGGLLGIALCRVQIENLYGLWWWSY